MTILPEKPTINDGKCTMKSTSASTHTKIAFQEMGGGAGWTSRGGRGDMPKIPSLSQTSKAKDNYINGLALDITVKTYMYNCCWKGN